MKQSRWWVAPRAAAHWLLSVAEQAIEQVEAERARRVEHGYSAAQRAMLEDAGGGRAGAVLALMFVVLGHEARPEMVLRLKRLRLWLREGWAPPELPPGSNEPL